MKLSVTFPKKFETTRRKYTTKVNKLLYINDDANWMMMEFSENWKMEEIEHAKQ